MKSKELKKILEQYTQSIEELQNQVWELNKVFDKTGPKKEEGCQKWKLAMMTEPQKPVAGWRKSRNLRYHLAWFDGKCFVYGFDTTGRWFDNIDLDDLSDNSCDIIIDTSDPADPKEVEARLIEEAKRMGYKEGVRVLYPSKDTYQLTGELRYSLGELVDGPNWIMSKGKWATIIEERLMLNGKEVEIRPETVLIGGEMFLIEDLKQLMTKIESSPICVYCNE